jgi:membrane protein implicated in regulation of membrane protease activity
MTWGFVYLLVFLGGMTLAIVTGLARRVLHPSELCDEVTAPSHEHWSSQHRPQSDVVISFAVLFGLATLLIHGVTALDPTREILIGAAAGVLGAVVIRSWMGRVCDPSRQIEGHSKRATVIRPIPANGFGQVEISVAGRRFKLAAKSSTGSAIQPGTEVEILDRQESVVIVSPSAV